MALVTGGSGSFPVLAAGKVSLTTGNLVTNSSTFVDAVGLTVTLTTGARRCLVTFAGTIANAASGVVTAIDVAVDGTRQGGSIGIVDNNNGVNFDTNASLSLVTDVLTAASHTIKLQFRSNAGNNATIFASATSPAIFTVVELPVIT